MHVAKWGNSLAIRLPAALIKALELHEGDDVVLELKKKPGNEAFLEKLRRFRGKLPADFTCERDDANARD